MSLLRRYEVLVSVTFVVASCGEPNVPPAPTATYDAGAQTSRAALEMAAVRAIQTSAGPVFAPQRRGGVLVADNPSHTFSVRFDDDGPALRGEAGWQLQFVSRGLRTQPEATGPRVSYRRGEGVVEWFENGPLGLEHGFDLAKRPAGSDRGVVLEVGVAGLRPELAADGTRIVLRDATGNIALFYGGLYAEDARGQVLPSALAVDGDHIELRVDDRAAIYPIEIDPILYTEQAKLVASNGGSLDEFGLSVAVSSDGNTAIIGAHLADVDHDNDVMTAALANAGAAYVFVRTGTVWTEQAMLIALDAATANELGFSVALSGDGNTAVVGAPRSSIGAGYVFVRSGTVWSEQFKLTATGGAAGDRVGISAAVSADGNVALLGASLDNAPLVDQGAAYAFVRSGTVWAQEGSALVALDGVTLDEFGNALALSSDGNTAIIGAHHANVAPGNADEGAAYVFVRSAPIWTQQAKLTGGDSGTTDEFGTSVAISGDGDTVIVGAHEHNIAAISNQGAAYVYTRSASVWSPQQKLLASDAAAADHFGSAVALSGDGNIAIVGARENNTTAVDVGSIYVFERVTGAWTQQPATGPLTAADGLANDFLGTSIALSTDGSTAVVGANLEDRGATTGTNEGAVYVFTLKLRGVSCSADTECVTGFCADGVCCNTACGGSVDTDCVACATAKGAPTNGTCDNRSSGSLCRAKAAGINCDAQEVCNGLSPSCPVDAPAIATTLCRPSAGVCDAIEVCSGASFACPPDGKVGTTVSCRAANGACDAEDFCDGATDGCADGKQPTTFVCNASQGGCDPAELCDGATNTCPADELHAATFTCRPAVGNCDIAEQCDCLSAQCPSADVKQSTSFVCRPSAGDCDELETCNGTSGLCPTDVKTGAGTQCRAAAGACDEIESCDGVAVDCPTDAKKTSECRAAAGACDVAESCDGLADSCPTDELQAATFTCRAAVGSCDIAERCNGLTAQCPSADLKQVINFVCRPSVGTCDVQEICDGVSGLCPADAAFAAGTECRAAAGACDEIERCDGAGADCPVDVKKTGECRAAAGACDVAESCDGVANSCPLDDKRPDGTACGDELACNGNEVCVTGACITEGPITDCTPDDDGGGGCCDASTGAPSWPAMVLVCVWFRRRRRR